MFCRRGKYGDLTGERCGKPAEGGQNDGAKGEEHTLPGWTEGYERT